MDISYAGRSLRVPNQDVAVQFENERTIRDTYWLVEPGQVVMDVGCYIGTYTLQALIAGAEVYAVDPFGQYLHAVQVLAKENGIGTKNLYCVNRALAAGPDGYSDELWAKVEAIPWQDIVAHRGDPFITLDELVDAQKIRQLDWIKIDTEGAELDVLHGGMTTLERFHPKMIIEDHTGVYPWVEELGIGPKCLDLLASLGYRVDVVHYEDERTSTADRDFWICR